MAHPQAEAHGWLQEGETDRDPAGQPVGPGGVAQAAESFGEIASVDRHGTGRGAQAIYRAGIQGHIWELGVEGRQ